VRIVVCVKQVPEVSELSLDPVTRRLVRDGVPLLINPFDRRAVLEAVRLREEAGSGSVTVLSMGPPQAEEALRECLGLTVDRAVLLCDPGFAGADTLATSRALADAIAQLGFDLVLAGRSSIDSETGQVGPEIAALLGIPLLAGVRRLRVDRPSEGAATWRVAAECEVDEGFSELEASLPAVVTCTDRWKSRIPRVMPDEAAAASGAILTWGVPHLPGPPSRYGGAGSPTWVASIEPVEVVRERRTVSAEEDVEPAMELAWAAIRTALEPRGPGAGPGREPEVPRHRPSDALADAVWVVGERAHTGRVRPVTRELLAAADGIAARLGCGVALVLIEPPSAAREPERSERAAGEALAREVGMLGADLLLSPADDAPPPSGAALAHWLGDVIREHRPRIVLAPATSLGREIVPWVAGSLGLGLTGDAIGVRLDPEGRLEQLKPAFGGQVVAPILSRTRPEMATLRPGVLAAIAPDPSRAAAKRVAGAGFAPDAEPVLRTSFVSEVGPEGAALEEARVVVCVGYGLGESAVPAAAELASLLGGSLAATRRVCDVGWLPRQRQIGISGRTVSPDLYLGLGVRGSFNHVVGMQRAGTVIAVNRDPDAEVFACADLGIVGDAPRFLEALVVRARAA
jgi:electron transfer flavoprotein alpha subunit